MFQNALASGEASFGGFGGMADPSVGTPTGPQAAGGQAQPAMPAGASLRPGDDHKAQMRMQVEGTLRTIMAEIENLKNSKPLDDPIYKSMIYRLAVAQGRAKTPQHMHEEMKAEGIGKLTNDAAYMMQQYLQLIETDKAEAKAAEDLREREGRSSFVNTYNAHAQKVNAEQGKTVMPIIDPISAHLHVMEGKGLEKLIPQADNPLADLNRVGQAADAGMADFVPDDFKDAAGAAVTEEMREESLDKDKAAAGKEEKIAGFTKPQIYDEANKAYFQMLKRADIPGGTVKVERTVRKDVMGNEQVIWDPSPTPEQDQWAREQAIRTLPKEMHPFLQDWRTGIRISVPDAKQSRDGDKPGVPIQGPPAGAAAPAPAGAQGQAGLTPKQKLEAAKARKAAKQ